MHPGSIQFSSAPGTVLSDSGYSDVQGTTPPLGTEREESAQIKGRQSEGEVQGAMGTQEGCCELASGGD